MSLPKRNRLSSPRAIALLAVFAAATPVAFVPIVEAGETIVKASGLDYLLTRSPGERDDTKLSPVKGKGASGKTTEAPEQRALGKIFDTPPGSDLSDPEPTTFETAMSTLPIGPLEEIATAPLGQPSDVGGTGNSPGASPSPLFLVPVANGGGGGGGGSADDEDADTGDPETGEDEGDPAPPPSVEVPSAVPEPSTWMLLVLGIGFVGAAMRRTRRLTCSA